MGAIVLLLVALSCGGGNSNSNPAIATPGGTGGTGGSGGGGSTANTSDTICNCTPSGPASTDFRHDQKHVGLPAATGQDITVATVLGWGAPPNPAANAPRTGVELQMFHLRAWVHFVWLVGSDCDIHMEISDSPDPNAPRIIAETPIDPVYCPARATLKAQLAAHNVPIGEPGYDLPKPLQVDVLGMAFQDYNHARGTVHVASPWEIHPAIVNVIE